MSYFGTQSNTGHNDHNSNKQTKVQISLYASKLTNVAGFGKGTSDPYAVLTLLAGSADERPTVLGKTEVIKNSLNPAWTHVFETNYTFGKETKFNVGIFDEVRKTGKSKTMGSAMFEVGEIMGSRGNIKAKRLRNGGTLFARVTAINREANYGTFQAQFRGIKLKNVEGLFSKSDPFFIISAFANDGTVGAVGVGQSWQPVYRSDTIQNNLNPVWPSFSIPMQRLCAGDKDRPIEIAVFDWEKSGKHTAMGKIQTTVNSLIFVAGGDEKTLKLMHKNKVYGHLRIDAATVQGNNLSTFAPSASSAATMVQRSATNAGAAMGGPPRKFVKINGVTQVNPDYKKWKLAQGQGNGGTNTATPAPMPSASGAPQQSNLPASSQVPPKKFIKINGLTKLNPAYQKWKESQSTSTATSSNAPTSTMPPLPVPIPPPQQTPVQPSLPDFSQALDNPPPALPPPMAPPQISPSAPPSPFSKSRPQKPKFIDYISGGTEISLAVAIDFTGSNGDPRQPGTLHHIHYDGQLNDYEKALTAVGSIVARYDSDQQFPVLGFGAKYGGVIQHCFQVGKASELQGISGMLEGYRGVFKTALTMSGPTVFADVIRYAASQARAKQAASAAIGEQSYNILLILTDGAVTDIEQTKIAIRDASTAPLSIVIVGIGNADFSAMQFLDDFQQNEGGHTRDIVQFVEFNRYKHNRQALTRETLDEIPDQLVEYFYSKGIMPLPPTSGSQINIEVDDYNAEEDVDLSMSMDSIGQLRLSDPKQATWNAQSYGNASNFLPKPSAPLGPGGTSGSYTSSSTYGQPTPGYAPSSTYNSSPANYSTAPNPNTSYITPPSMPQGAGGPYGGQTSSYSGTMPYSAAPSTNIIHVRAPANSHPGMKVQVKNPRTGQFHVVAIPQGVAPGGTFGVRI